VKYIDEYRDGDRMRALLDRIRAEATDRSYRFMEFCGGHTHALYRYGLISALPDTIKMVHGPGCPVCVLPAGRIDAAVDLAMRDKVIFCSYGDMLRVPGSDGRSLLKSRARGADVRMLYSPLDALKLARENPGREVIFFAVGFETTAPATALTVKQAAEEGLANFSVFCNHVLTPPAMQAILGDEDEKGGDENGAHLDGIVGPGHVSAVIGSRAYEAVVSGRAMPLVISGFEPVDLLESILMLVEQVNEGRATIENQYGRAVREGGNTKAIDLMGEVFEQRGEFEWRGLGVLPSSAQKLAADFAAWDAEIRFAVSLEQVADHKACRCADVLRGRIQPEACSVFARACTPETPLGACMVSSEGACAAAFAYGEKQMERGA